MTKKHFIALADTLRFIKPHTNHDKGVGLIGVVQWERTVAALADFCAAQSSRFDRERWLAYVNGKCGPNGGAK